MKGLSMIAFIVTLYFFGVVNIVKAQEEFSGVMDFLTPPPNAAAITEYGLESLKGNTGAVNVDIPLVTAKGYHLSADVGIGYNSGGLKVDQIASRVGMGWALKAGGVITRTVLGKVDEKSQREYPPDGRGPLYSDGSGPYSFGINWPTVSWAMRNLYPVSNREAQSDIYACEFDGYAGSWVNDGAGHMLEVNQTGIRIEGYQNSSSWNFRVTDVNGIRYYFGGSNATEKTKRTTSCGKYKDQPIETAWYLTKVEDPNTSEVITFNYTSIEYSYDNGVSESLYLENHNLSCNQWPSNKCVNKVTVTGFKLSEIISNGMTIFFTYTNRTDCNDNLVKSITTYFRDGSSASNVLFTNYYFDYETVTSNSFLNEFSNITGVKKTPYLKSIRQESPNNARINQYYFSYYNPEKRPPRLSFAQDHWGYFNGKDNTTLLPGGDVFWNAANFPSATADRSVDPVTTQYGLLKTVVYPTGGTSTFFYEGHVKDNLGQSTPVYTKHNLSNSLSGTGTNTSNSSTKEFDIVVAQPVKLRVHCNGSNPPGHSSAGTVIFHKQNSGWSQTIVIGAGDDYIQDLYLDAGSYSLKLTAQGSAFTANIEFEYLSVENNTQINKVQVGGVRLARVVSSENGDNKKVKKFFYGSHDAPGTSTIAGTGIDPKYFKFHLCYSPGPQGGQGSIFAAPFLYSNSVNPLGYFNGAPISYGTILESEGENFEGGAIETEYYTETDSKAVRMNDFLFENTVVVFYGYLKVPEGDEIANCPMSNNSSQTNGKVRKITLYKVNDGVFIPQTSKETIYHLDFSRQKEVLGYQCESKFGYVASSSPSADTLCYTTEICKLSLKMAISELTVMKYRTYSNWVYPQSVTETMYDENGANPLVTTTEYFYDDPNYYGLTNSQTRNSRGELISSHLYYPYDKDGETVYATMTGKNIVAPVIESVTRNEDLDIELSHRQVDYQNTIQGIFPYIFEASVKGNPLTVEGEITLRDFVGNILEYTGKDKIVHSVIWGYDGKYPVADITGLEYSTALTSLGVSPQNLQSITDPDAILAAVDNIRIANPKVLVSAYGYSITGKLLASTDPNKIRTEYVYDEFNRLLSIKQNKKILKQFQYDLVTPDPNAGIQIYTNAAQSHIFQCTACLPGYNSTQSFTYSVPAGRYFSSVSQSEADQLALDEIALNGQVKANRSLTCYYNGCVGEGYKYINDHCVLGTKVYDNCSAENQDGSFTKYYHYHWPDNTNSSSYSEVVECSGTGKKKVGCNCETGERVCEDTPTETDGIWQATYHYHWSDGSNSSSQTGNFTCTGPQYKMIGCPCEEGQKIYISAQLCDGSNPPQGCAPGKWLCTFYYKWSNGTDSRPVYYTELHDEACEINDPNQ